MKSLVFIVSFFIFLLLGCGAKLQLDLSTPTPSPSPSASPVAIATPNKSTTTTPTPTPQGPPALALSWDTTDERKAWSKELLKLASEYRLAFEKAKDVKDFCPKIESLDSADLRTKAFAEFMLAVIYFESGYNPLSRMMEPQTSFPKPDSITGNPVYSEGFFQLSYQDARGYKFCNEFDWAKDKPLHAKDPKNPKITILDPYKNMRCGVRIINHWLSKDGAISAGEKGAWRGAARYWSVVRGEEKRKRAIERMKARAPKCFQ